MNIKVRILPVFPSHLAVHNSPQEPQSNPLDRPSQSGASALKEDLSP